MGFYFYSEFSLDTLQFFHPDLKYILEESLQHRDHRVVSGWRSKEEQNRLYYMNRSKKKGGQSRHNNEVKGVPCSLAVDCHPCVNGKIIQLPNPWDSPTVVYKKMGQFYMMAGCIITIGERGGIPIRWGGDWDMDSDFLDNNFDDLYHFELYGDNYPLVPTGG